MEAKNTDNEINKCLYFTIYFLFFLLEHAVSMDKIRLLLICFLELKSMTNAIIMFFILLCTFYWLIHGLVFIRFSLNYGAKGKSHALSRICICLERRTMDDKLSYIFTDRVLSYLGFVFYYMTSIYLIFVYMKLSFVTLPSTTWLDFSVLLIILIRYLSKHDEP